MTKLTEKKIASNVAYNRRQDAIMLRPNKETGAAIRQAAQAAGKPLQRYILDAVLEKIAQEK